MEVNSLYIVGGDETKITLNIDKTSKVIFLDKVQKGFDNQLLLIKKLQDHQDILRKKFLKLQEQVFKKINHLIESDADFKYLLSNLFFEASPYKTNLIYKFFKLNLIIDFIKENEIKKLYLLNVAEDIESFFYQNSNKLSYSIKKVSTHGKSRSYKSFFKSSLIGTLLNRLIIELRKRKTRTPTQYSQSRKVVLSSYPGHSFHNGFSSHYFADVSGLLNNDDYAWLFVYSGNISKLNEESKSISANVNSFGFLDTYFSLINFKEIFINFIRIKKKLKSIKLDNLFIFDDINYLNIIKDDWNASISISLINILIFEKKIKNFFKVNSNVEEIIYLMEYHPWELVLNKIAHENNVKTKGVVHSIVRPNLMNYYCSKLIHPFYYSPSYVGANNDFSRSRFLDNGFDSDQVFKIEAQRYNYLFQYFKELKYEKENKTKSILITTSINFKETKELLEMFVLSKVKFDKVYIKEHPHMPVKQIINSSIKEFPSYELVKGSMQDAFQYSDIVYVVNSSSVLLESVLLKKHTITYLSLSTLPIPAVDSAPNLYFVEDATSLSNTLTKLISLNKVNIPKNDIKNDLYLNKDLSLWRKFLNK